MFDRIDNDPSRLGELTDVELIAAERMQTCAGQVIATQLFKRLNRDGVAAGKLLEDTLNLPAQRIEKRARKAKRYTDEGKSPSATDLAALLVWCRAEHTALETEIAFRESRKATHQ